MKQYWGLDLGGTKIEGVVLESLTRADPVLRLRVDTEAERGYQHIIEQVAKLVSLMKEQTGKTPEAIGIGHPGVVDPKTGLLKNSNTTCMNGMPIKKDIEHALGIKTLCANDANCFALAETRYGAAIGANVVFGVIMGTGVGGGIVVNNQVLYGCQGIAGEWGHNVLLPDGPECYCGKRGCVETILSGPGLEKFYEKSEGQKKKLGEIAEEAAKLGPTSAGVKTISRLTENFGRAISVVINILDPDCVVLGGGVSNVDALYEEGIERVKKNVFNNRLETKIVKNQLGDSAGVFGAALLTA